MVGVPKTNAIQQNHGHLYGPVPSRRLGRSLGVDIVPYKVCSYDCVYCQLGRTTRLTKTPEALVGAEEAIGELRAWLESGGTADYVTFAGSGEPTLNSEIGRMMREARELTDIPLAVLTNGSLLSQPEVLDAIKDADLLAPSLDAGTEEIFLAINRPADGIGFGEMCEGLARAVREFRGETWLEIMLVSGFNDSESELTALRDVAHRIAPARIQINTVDRPSASGDAEAVTSETLELARRIMGSSAEIISERIAEARDAGWSTLTLDAVQAMLNRRPCTARDIAAATGLYELQVHKLLRELVLTGFAEPVGASGKQYYRPKATGSRRNRIRIQ